MVFKVTDDKRFLQLIDSTEIELAQLNHSLTKKLANWFIIKKKCPNWNCEVSFIDTYGRVPIGLVYELKNIAKKYLFEIKIQGIEHITNPEFKQDEFIKWIDDLFKDSEDFKPYYYQIEAAVKALKYKKCIEEISTSGGKTLIAYLLFKYLYDKEICKKFLYIVPNISLISQTEEKFYEYDEKLCDKISWKSLCIFSGAKKEKNIDDINIIFGTYQSITKKDIEFFKAFDWVVIDECHHSANNSLKSILTKCCNAEYKIGLTGTLPEEDSCNWFTLQSYIGPKVYEVHSAQLINEKKATPVKIVQLELNYLEKDVKENLFKLRSVRGDEKDGAKLLNLEKQIARENRKRFIYICEHIKKLNKNTLVMFSDIQNEYGRKVYDWLRDNVNDKTIYYIDGSTTSENRDYYKNQIELNNDVILVASSGTFSEGVDIKNIGSINVIESHKSQFIVRQILGRGMRLLDGKEHVIIFDFSDNYSWGSGNQRDNYLLRHGKEREKIYKERKFPFKKFIVDL